MATQNTQTNTTGNTTLPAQIEIFRAGMHMSEGGTQHTFSAADVEAMAQAYSSANGEAPLVVGHPKTNNPAFGWVDKLHVKDGVLLMDTKDVQPAFADMVRSKRFKKRSASFYPPKHPNNPKPGTFYLRHVGFLGAQPPAVKGLADIPDFADDDTCPCFSEAVGDAAPADSNSSTDLPPQPAQTTEPEEDDDMSEQLKKDLAKAQADKQAAEEAKAEAEAKAEQAAKETQAAKKEAADFAESIKKQRDAEIASFAEAQIKAGKLTPAEQPLVTALLKGATDMEPVSFGEGDGKKDIAPIEFLKGLIASRQPVVNFGEVAVVALAAPSAANLSDEELDKKAQAYAAEHSVSYSEALDKVTTFTQ